MSRCTLRRSDERIFLAGNEFFGNSGLHSSRRARGAYDLHHPGILQQREQVTERPPEQATKVSSCFCTTRRWYITRRKVIQQSRTYRRTSYTIIFPRQQFVHYFFNCRNLSSSNSYLDFWTWGLFAVNFRRGTLARFHLCCFVYWNYWAEEVSCWIRRVNKTQPPCPTSKFFINSSEK